MKKFLMLGVMALSCQLGHSQYQPGDYYQEDGLDCVVIKVDEDGQSGLVMTLPGLLAVRSLPGLLNPDPVSALENAVDLLNPNMMKAGKAARAQLAAMGSAASAFLEKRAVHLRAMAGKIGACGALNCDAIKAYCADNKLEMKDYFPEYAYVSQWGDGWFLPGDVELGYLAEVIGYGLGKKAYKGKRLQDVLAKIDEVNRKMPAVDTGEMAERMGLVSMGAAVDTVGLSDAMAAFSESMAAFQGRLDEKLESQNTSMEELMSSGMRFGFSLGTKIASSSVTIGKKQVLPHVFLCFSDVSGAWWAISDDERKEMAGQYFITVPVQQDYFSSFVVGVKEVDF